MTLAEHVKAMNIYKLRLARQLVRDCVGINDGKVIMEVILRLEFMMKQNGDTEE